MRVQNPQLNWLIQWSVMTNSKLFTPFEVTHFHDGKHTNADHPAEVTVENVSTATNSGCPL
jgi:hypothetical protein